METGWCSHLMSVLLDVWWTIERIVIPIAISVAAASIARRL